MGIGRQSIKWGSPVMTDMPENLKKKRDELATNYPSAFLLTNNDRIEACDLIEMGFDLCYAENKKWCPCGDVILADTENWPIPMCHGCAEDIYLLAVPEIERLQKRERILVKALEDLKTHEKGPCSQSCACLDRARIFSDKALEELKR